MFNLKLTLVNLAISILIVYFGHWWQIILWGFVQLIHGCAWFYSEIKQVGDAMEDDMVLYKLVWAWQSWVNSLVHFLAGFVVIGLNQKIGSVLLIYGLVHFITNRWTHWKYSD